MAIIIKLKSNTNEILKKSYVSKSRRIFLTNLLF